MEEQQSLVPKRRLAAWYEKKYKVLLILPLLLLVLSISQIIYQTSTTGDFLHKGVSLKGGVIITLDVPADEYILRQAIQTALPESDIEVTALGEGGSVTGTSITIDINPEDATAFKAVEQALLLSIPNLELESIRQNTQTITSQFSDSFFSAVIRALILAFIFMGIVVFFYFKTPVPSLAVILAAASDIIVTLAIVNVMGLKVSSAGIAAFLMLIGYSVDTDILLTTKVLKQKSGSVSERILKAMKTGLTMNITTVAAMSAALYFTISDDIRQIMIILIIGLLVDNINTWLQNVGILRYYLERKHRGHT